jgi:isopentenyldiphosphate isomerase
MPDEMLDVVNENNDEVIEQAPRSAVHARGLWHRGAHVFLFDNGGRLLVQKRSADRAASPSLLDGSVSEHIKAGEDYPSAASRGLWEEMGLEGLDLRPRVRFRMNYGLGDNEISTLFVARADAPMPLFDPEEVDAILWLAPHELEAAMDESPEKFCGWFIEIFHWYLGKPSAIIVLQEWPSGLR